MKHILLTTIAAVLVVGCGESDHQHSHDDGHSHAEGDHDHIERDGHDHDKELKAAEPVVEASQPEPPTAKAPDISIHDAAYDGNIEVVKQHLAAGTDVNAKDEDGCSVLDIALTSKNEELINFVKTTGGKSNADKSIFIASGVGDLEAVKQHLAAGTEVDAKGKFGRRPLHIAASEGRKEVAELLIAEGADLEAIDWRGWTPLFRAAVNGHKEIVEVIIDEGADVNAKDEEGETPLDWAYGETADLLRKYGGKHGTIHSAAYGGDIEAVKEFLAAGADVNAKTEDGVTPLDFAKRHPEIADLLRKHGGKTGEELKAEGK